MSLDIEDGMDLIIKAISKQAEKMAWDLYLTKYPYMDDKNYISFKDFYNPQKPELKSEADILTEVKEILDTFKGGEIHGTV